MLPSTYQINAVLDFFFYKFLNLKKAENINYKKEKKKKKLRGTTSFPANWKESFFFFLLWLEKNLKLPKCYTMRIENAKQTHKINKI